MIHIAWFHTSISIHVMTYGTVNYVKNVTVFESLTEPFSWKMLQ